MIEDLNRLRKEMVNDVTNIPDFIDTKTETGRAQWELIKYIIRVISKLTENRILPVSVIYQRNNEVSAAMDHLIEITTDNFIFLLIFEMILNSIEKYIMRCLDMELYEVAENIRKFNVYFLRPDEEE